MITRKNIETRGRAVETRIETHKYSQHLYHYTSFASLYGILAKQELWLCSTSSMNDTSEMRDFIWKIKDALIQDIPSEQRVFCLELFKKIDARLNSEYPFAICFSDLEDNAAQWERYANNAQGVCIVFNTRSLMALPLATGVIFQANKDESTIFLPVVIYISIEVLARKTSLALQRFGMVYHLLQRFAMS